MNKPPHQPATRNAAAVRSGDTPLLLTVIVLVVFGLLMLYSASLDYSLKILGKAPTYMFNRQLLWLGLGVVVAFGFSHFDYHRWRRLSVPAMLLTIAALIGVLLINEIRLGATRTFYQGSVQPSELAKLVTVIYLAVWLYAKRDQIHDVQLGLIPLGIILGVVGGLIYLQPDLSAAGTVLILGGMLFFLAGSDLRQIIFLLVAAVIAAWIVVQFSSTGQERISSYLTGIKDPTQSSYHVRRSLEAIVRGNVFGVGIGRGSTKVTGLPVPPTDSIFAVIAEELGLLGAIFLIGLYGVMVWRGLVIARRAPDMLGTLLATGLVFWIGMEALINMAVMVGLLPFAGNALPFISSGGSSLTASLAAIGILLNVSRQRGEGATTDDDWRAFDATSDLRRRNRRRRVPRARHSQRRNARTLER
ncbi:MAG: cell division protein FtsW [Chloroflexi bacterium]|nr:cell division protein FtsW [Chloroflexota bacterium]